MTTPSENAPTEKAAPEQHCISCIVAPGRTLMSSEDKGAINKIHKAGTAVDIEEPDAQRLAALGFVILPGGDDGTDAPPPEQQSRAKGRFSISPKDGPRVDR